MPIWPPNSLLILTVALALAPYLFVRSRRINQNLQKSAVQARQQQALAAAIMEIAVEGFITIDDAGTVQSFNAAAEKMFGYIAAEVIGQNISLLLPAPYAAQHDHFIANYLTTGERKIIGLRRELSGLRNNGEEFPMDLAISEVIVDGERSFACIVSDVSERSRFVAEMQASQRQLRRIIDLVPHMIFAKDVEGRIILANQAVADACQTSVDNILNISQQSLHKNALALTDMLNDDQRVIANDEPLMVPEQNCTDSKGQRHVLQTYKMPLEYGVDKTPALLGVAVDITELKDKEAALQANNKRLNSLIENAAIAIDACLFGEGIATSNKAFQQLIGYSAEELAQLTLQDITHPDDWPESLRLAQSALAGEIASYQQRKRDVGKTSEIVHVDAYDAFTFDGSGRAALLMGQPVNFTERLASEQQVREAEAELAQTNHLALLGEMAAGLAHEINQPIAAISIYAQAGKRFLQEQRFDRLEEVCDKLSNEVLRAGAVVERIQLLAKHQTPEFAAHDVNQLIKEVHQLAAIDIRLKNAAVTLVLADKLTAVRCDGGQVQQVIVNLLQNAAEATQQQSAADKAVITIESRELDRVVEIAVIDRGVGVLVSDHEQIFAPFSSGKKGRVGMGLAICRYIVDLHHGQIDCRANADGGTTFYFTLPFASPE